MSLFRAFEKLAKINSSAFTITLYSFVLGYADIYFANCFIQTLKYFPFYKQIMCKFSPKSSHSKHLVPDYDIMLNYDYWSNTNSDYGSTSFVEGEIIGMEFFHKLDVPLIHLKTRSEKDDQENQEEREYDCKIKNKLNTEFVSKSIIDHNLMNSLDIKTISTKHEDNPSISVKNVYGDKT